MDKEKERTPQSNEDSRTPQSLTLVGEVARIPKTDAPNSSSCGTSLVGTSAGQKRNHPETADVASHSSVKQSKKVTTTETPDITSITSANGSTVESAITNQSSTACSPSVIDITKALNLKPGDRIEVRWDLHFETVEADEEDDKQLDIATKETAENEGGNGAEISQTRWWGGTLLQPDDRMHTLQDPSTNDTVQVPIRVIDYDPYIEGGFPDRSLEDVCFLTDHSLYNMGSSEDNANSRMWWRKEGDDWMPGEDMEEEERKLMMGPVSQDRISNNKNSNANPTTSDDEISVTSTSREDALKVVLDGVLQGALQKAGIGERMNQLQPSQQSFMAEKIARAKEKLTQKLIEQLNNSCGDGDGGGLEQVITKEHIQRCMEDLKEL